MAEEGRQGRPHTVELTVRILHALDKHDALVAALNGAGKLVSTEVAEDAGEVTDPLEEDAGISGRQGRQQYLPF